MVTAEQERLREQHAKLQEALLPTEAPSWDAWVSLLSLCPAFFCPCISLSRATPLRRPRFHTSEFPTESPTHTIAFRLSGFLALPTRPSPGTHGLLLPTQAPSWDAWVSLLSLQGYLVY